MPIRCIEVVVFLALSSELHQKSFKKPVLDPEDRNDKNDKNDKPQAGPKIKNK